MNRTASAELAIPTVDDGSLSSPDDFVRAIGSLLANEQVITARRMAARAAALFADHPWIEKANRVLNPSRIVAEPATAPDRTREFAWLRQHSAQYRGQWVALLGAELLASGPDVEEVLREVRSRNLQAHPLVHRID